MPTPVNIYDIYCTAYPRPIERVEAKSSLAVRKAYAVKHGCELTDVAARRVDPTHKKEKPMPKVPSELEKSLARMVAASADPFSSTNVHPVDELALIREEIKKLETRADFLKDRLKEDGADLNGDTYFAVVSVKTRETLDRKAITEAFGEEAIAPFLKTTRYKQVDLKEKP